MAAANQVVTLKSVTNERVVVLLSRLVQFTCCKETFTVLLILVSRKFFLLISRRRRAVNSCG